MFGVFFGTNKCVEAFKNKLKFGILEWESKQISKKVDMLYLTISIKNNQVSFRTFQKKINLYLYVPKSSAYTPEMLKGLIIVSLQ